MIHTIKDIHFKLISVLKVREEFDEICVIRIFINKIFNNVQ